MKKRTALMFLCVLMGVGGAQAQLKIDFTVTGGPVEVGYQGYFATRGQPATFTAQSYSVFDTTVTIKPTWAGNAAAAAHVTINRTGANSRYTGILPNLINTWIGTDTRQVGNPMTLTISGLPAGTYSWLSYHHDALNQTGQFEVTVNDASGSATTSGIDITDSGDSGIVAFEYITKFTTTIMSDGTSDVALVFRQTSPTSPLAQAFFVMNGFELTLTGSNEAIVLTPAAGATDVPRDGAVLSWIPSNKAVAHGVYLGADHDEIDDGTTASAVYMGRQDANSFDLGRLEMGKTYYWRVDEIASDGTVVKGDVWSFTAEPISIALAASHIKATASGSNSDTEGPEKTIDGSGLNADNQHSTDTDDMWLSVGTDSGAAWIQYEFDTLYELHRMLVWNHNSGMESLIGFGAKGVAVAYSRDGIDWAVLDTPRELAQASGTADYAANTVVDFDGVAAKYVRIDIAGNWGGAVKQVGLSEVRFMVVSVTARQPQPASGATGVDPRSPLSWRAGREAAVHKVYVSIDANEVANTPVGAVSEPSFDAAELLELDKTYYWRVDEVNDQEAQTVWQGDVWSFTVRQYLVIDDFESYTNDSPKRVFQHWIDGLGFSEDAFFPKGHPGNGSGSMVGYDPMAGKIMEPFTRHGGAQSMPMGYDSSAAAYSEAEHTFDAPQDWTRHGVKALVLWFHGNPTNTASQMYVKVNGSKVVYDGDADNILRRPWHPWYIPLSQFTGVDLSKVTRLAIGFAGGQGLVFFDDIALAAHDRQSVTPVKPDAANLVAFYALEGDTNSSTGTLPGTAGGAPTFVAGRIGQAIKLNGATDHVTMQGSLDLPVYSAALWFKVEGGTAERDLLSIYNDAGAHGVLLEVRPNGGLRFLHRAPVGGSGGTDVYCNGKYDDGAWYHVAIVKSADMLTMYVNGEQAGSAADTTRFEQALTRMILGALKHDSASRHFPGEIDEVYLYNRVLSQAEVAWLAGLTEPFNK